MKKFTQKECIAATSAVMTLSDEKLRDMTSEEIVEVVLDAVNEAEGLSEGSGDKYIDARNEIKKCLKELNKAIEDAHSLGLQMQIDRDYTPAPAPLGWSPGVPSAPASVPVSKPLGFKLYKLTKDFDIE